MGYHTHTNTNGTTEKCIIAKSSWCNYIPEHHIRQTYFTSGNTNSAWVMIGTPMNQNQAKVVKSRINGHRLHLLSNAFYGLLIHKVPTRRIRDSSANPEHRYALIVNPFGVFLILKPANLLIS